MEDALYIQYLWRLGNVWPFGQPGFALWQRRFNSVAMDQAHFVSAPRYVALDPDRAG